jgi:hypothetical protein
MRKFNFLLGIICSIVFISCEYVKPNYVGILQENYGKNGKSDFSLQKGKVWTGGAGTELYQVPLYEQRAKFESSLHPKAADNTEFSANPIYTYKVIESRAVDVVFNNRQLGSSDNFMTSLENNVLEPKIYDIIKEVSRKHITDSLMANSGSLKLEQEVEKWVREEFDSKGIELTTFSINLDFSDKVKNKIDQRNEVNTNVSVIDQQIIEQKKRNELEELKTAQKLIESRGITKEILQREYLQKWNGVLPTTVSGNSDILLNVPSK